MRGAKGMRGGRRGAVRSRVTRLRQRAARGIGALRRAVVATAVPIAMMVSQTLAARPDGKAGCEGPTRRAPSAPAGPREAMADPPGEAGLLPQLSLTLASGMVVAGQMVAVTLVVCGPVEEQLVPRAVTIELESVGTLGSIRTVATWRPVRPIQGSR